MLGVCDDEDGTSRVKEPAYDQGVLPVLKNTNTILFPRWNAFYSAKRNATQWRSKTVPESSNPNNTDGWYSHTHSTKSLGLHYFSGAISRRKYTDAPAQPISHNRAAMKLKRRKATQMFFVDFATFASMDKESLWRLIKASCLSSETKIKASEGGSKPFEISPVVLYGYTLIK